MEFNNEATFASLVAHTGAQPVYVAGKLQAPLACPYCFSYSDEDNMKSSFGNVTPPDKYGGWAFHCFVCHTTESMYSIAAVLGAEVSDRVTIPKPRKRRKNGYTFTWMEDAEAIVAGYEASEKKYPAWMEYKHVGERAVDHWRLGVGVLPQTRHREERLITPIVDESSRVQWIRGRVRRGEAGQKWVGAGGIRPTEMPLYMGWVVARGKPLFIVENWVDALIINEYFGDNFRAIPTLSVAYWSERWLNEIVERRPSQVVVAFDPDLAGNGPVSKQHARQLLSQRIAKAKGLDNDEVVIKKLSMRGRRWAVGYETPDGEETINLPQPFGIQRANQIMKAGIPSTTAAWTRPGMDVGDFLAIELTKRSRSKGL